MMGGAFGPRPFTGGNTVADKKERLKRLRALVKDQPEAELLTQFASAVAEIAELEAELDTSGRKAGSGSDRKKKDDEKNRSE